MAIKWKGWTARRAVKICCILLIPVMAFVFLMGAFGLARMDYEFSENLLFTDLSNNDYFYDIFVPNAFSRAQSVFAYQSEEAIRDMSFIEWRPVDSPWNDRSGEQWLELVGIKFGSVDYTWGQVRASDLESNAAKEMLAGIVNNQLSEFYYDNKWLEERNGLYYYITDGERVLTNLPPNQGIDFFRTQPVYLIEENGRTSEQSRQGNARYNYWYHGNYYEGLTAYVAFSQEMVDWQNAQWRILQQQLGIQIIIMAAPALAALALLIILLSGAGRRYGDSSGGVHFTALDKPWLDIGLFLLVIFEVMILALIIHISDIVWRYNNTSWIIALCAALSVCFTLPILWWLSNFAKRCKARKWWRYTLIYAVFHEIAKGLTKIDNGLRSFIKSLWTGFSLAVRGAFIAFASLVAMLITHTLPLMSIVFAAVVAALLLRYARRLHLVEQGAKAASEGNYNASINVTGGELGSIAASINNISHGINDAVTERMKSERLKTELITNVSHDIRTPLTSLITYTDLLKNEGLDSEKAPEYLEILIQKSARLKTLTDDLFEASKAASGNIQAQIDNLDFADFVRQVLGELDERVRSSELDFRLNLPEHAIVRADGKLMWRVMENLLSNVFKYAGAGSRVYIDVVPDGQWYRMDIKNISEHPLNVEPSELIERFKRGDSARAGEGSGLGLSIAQSFVQSQGGRFALSIDGDLFKATVYLPN